MNKNVGVQLLSFGFGLGILGCVVGLLAEPIARPTLVTGLVGGLLSILWGARALRGNPGKALPILSLIPVIFMLVGETVLAWAGAGPVVPRRATAATVITVMCLASFFMLIRIAYAGLALNPGPPAQAKAHSPGKKAPPRHNTAR